MVKNRNTPILENTFPSPCIQTPDPASIPSQKPQLSLSHTKYLYKPNIFPLTLPFCSAASSSNPHTPEDQEINSERSPNGTNPNLIAHSSFLFSWENRFLELDFSFSICLFVCLFVFDDVGTEEGEGSSSVLQAR